MARLGEWRRTVYYQRRGTHRGRPPHSRGICANNRAGRRFRGGIVLLRSCSFVIDLRRTGVLVDELVHFAHYGVGVFGETVASIGDEDEFLWIVGSFVDVL